MSSPITCVASHPDHSGLPTHYHDQIGAPVPQTPRRPRRSNWQHQSRFQSYGFDPLLTPPGSPSPKPRGVPSLYPRDPFVTPAPQPSQLARNQWASDLDLESSSPDSEDGMFSPTGQIVDGFKHLQLDFASSEYQHHAQRTAKPAPHAAYASDEVEFDDDPFAAPKAGLPPKRTESLLNIGLNFWLGCYSQEIEEIEVEKEVESDPFDLEENDIGIDDAAMDEVAEIDHYEDFAAFQYENDENISPTASRFYGQNPTSAPGPTRTQGHRRTGSGLSRSSVASFSSAPASRSQAMDRTARRFSRRQNRGCGEDDDSLSSHSSSRSSTSSKTTRSSGGRQVYDRKHFAKPLM